MNKLDEILIAVENSYAPENGVVVVNEDAKQQLKTFILDMARSLCGYDDSYYAIDYHEFEKRIKNL